MPGTIRSLLLAGIKVWVLTGDKLETAVNVGHASALIRPDSNVFTIRSSSRGESISAQLTRAFREMAESDLKVCCVRV